VIGPVGVGVEVGNVVEVVDDAGVCISLVQFLIGLDGTFRNGNQLELVLKF
jgi:hypothetical protein